MLRVASGRKIIIDHSGKYKTCEIVTYTVKHAFRSFIPINYSVFLYMVRTLLIVCIISLSVTTASAQTWLEYYDSTYLYWEKDWKKSIELLNKALPLAEKDIGDEHPNFAVLLNDLSICYWKSGDFKLATSTLERSLRIKKVSLGEEDPDYKASLLNLANILHDNNNRVRAENLYMEVIESYDSTSFKDGYYVAALNNLGSLYERQALFSQAEKYYLEVLTYTNEAAGDSHSTYAKALHNLGNLYKKTGNIKKAEEHFEKSLMVFTKNNRHELEFAALLSDYGLFFADRGNFSKAEEYLKQSEAIVIHNKGKSSREFAASLNNLGTLSYRMGKVDEAEKLYMEAVALYDQLLPDNSTEFAPALNNLAGFYVSSGQFEKAFPLYSQVQHLYADNFGVKHPLYANTLNNIASLYRKTKNYTKAELLYKEVLKIEKEVLGDEHPQYASSLQNLGLLSIATGNYSNAEAVMKEAIGIKNKILEPHHPSWARTYNNLALLYFLQNEPTEASPLFIKALENQFLQIKNVFPSLSEREKEAFYSTLKDDIERFNTYALSQINKDPSMAAIMYNNQLLTKGLLLDASNKIRENIFASNDEALIKKYNDWRTLRNEIAHAYQLSKEVLLQRQIDLDGLVKKANSLEKELSSQSYALNTQGEWQELTWEDIRAKLAPGEAAIEIIRFREFAILPDAENKNDTSDHIKTSLIYGWTEKVNYAALIVTPETKERPKLILLEEGSALENQYFSYYSNGIRYKVLDNLSYQRYWQKIQNEISGINTVYFSPDGAFHKINVNTLYDSVNAQYVLDKVNIKQLTSTRDLYFSKPKGDEEDQAVLFGDPAFNFNLNDIKYPSENEIRNSELLVSTIRENDIWESNPFIAPLPGTKTEVSKIFEILSDNDWNAQTYLNEDALEKSLKNVNSPKVLHIATHGYFNDDSVQAGEGENNPLLNSGLLFAGAQNSLSDKRHQVLKNPREEDGILTAFEAMNLKLDNTDLVVLSACETGSGTIKNGEGVYGLQRSFQVAGTSSIIFSLWKVDDEATQKLMTYFYKHWMANDNKREAFVKAQQELKKAFPDPYYWGAFILIGD